jgi:hypothetical protein
MQESSTNLKMYKPVKYRICVQGVVDESWADYYSNMTIRVVQQPGRNSQSTLIGWLQDQAALMGVLERLYGLCLPILSVEHIPE